MNWHEMDLNFKEYRRSPRISLITICLNSAETIGQTIESVAAQKDDNLEYIVIDGGSTDGTQKILEHYAGVIDYFISEPDKGISDAFNKGIEAASTDIVGLINADDALLPGAINSVRKAFVDNSWIEVLHGDLLLHDTELFIKRVKPSGRWWYPWRLVLFNHPATFVRREVYQQYGGFDPTYRIAMDVEIFLRWMKAGVKIHYLPEPLARMQAGGLSGRSALEGYCEVRKALVGHGFSKVLAYIQYFARLALCGFVSVKTRTSSFKL